VHRPVAHRLLAARPDMSSRPQRRRGRLTEQQEAAAKKLRDLREGGGASSLEQVR
jgi:hypothetical protein